MLGALLEKQVQDVIAEFEKTWSETASLAIPERIDALIEHMVDMYMVNAQVRRELFLIVSRLQKLEEILKLRRMVVKRMAGWMEESLSIENAETKSFVLLNATLGVLMTAIVDRESKIDREALKAELRKLSKNYLEI